MIKGFSREYLGGSWELTKWTLNWSQTSYFPFVESTVITPRSIRSWILCFNDQQSSVLWPAISIWYLRQIRAWLRSTPEVRPWKWYYPFSRTWKKDFPVEVWIFDPFSWYSPGVSLALDPSWDYLKNWRIRRLWIKLRWFRDVLRRRVIMWSGQWCFPNSIGWFFKKLWPFISLRTNLRFLGK